MLINMFAVLMPPTNVKNPSSPISPTTLVAMMAACDDPKPGRKAAMNPMPVAPDTDFTRFLVERFKG